MKSLLGLAIGAAAAASATPPRGWRSWIAFVHDLDQPRMLAAMDALHKPRPHLVPAKSLQQLGFSDVGVDGGHTGGILPERRLSLLDFLVVKTMQV